MRWRIRISMKDVYDTIPVCANVVSPHHQDCDNIQMILNQQLPSHSTICGNENSHQCNKSKVWLFVVLVFFCFRINALKFYIHKNCVQFVMLRDSKTTIHFANYVILLYGDHHQSRTHDNAIFAICFVFPVKCIWLKLNLFFFKHHKITVSMEYLIDSMSWNMNNLFSTWTIFRGVSINDRAILFHILMNFSFITVAIKCNLLNDSLHQYFFYSHWIYRGNA